MIHLDLAHHRINHFDNDERQAKLTMVLTAIMSIVTVVLITAAILSTRACQV